MGQAHPKPKIKDGMVFSPHLAYLSYCISKEIQIEDLLPQLELTDEVFSHEFKSLFPDSSGKEFTGNLAEDLKILVRKIKTKKMKIMVDADDLHHVAAWLGSKQNQISEHSMKDIKCVIKRPPTRAVKSHEQIIASIGMKGISIQNGDEGPIVVTSIMSSRNDTDIERDMKKANVSDADCKNIILLRIVPVNNPNSYQEQDTKDRFKLDLTFLVGVLDLNLLECEHNKQAVAQFVTYVDK